MAEAHTKFRQAIRIVLADGHALARQALELLLARQHDWRVVAGVDDVSGALHAAAIHHPDIVVLDLDIPGGAGLDAIGQILHRSPSTSIVVLAGHPRPAVDDVLRAGAHGFVLKTAAQADLTAAVRAALHARTNSSPSLVLNGDQAQRVSLPSPAAAS